MPDDLFVVVNARRTSVSFTSDMDTLPQFLQRYLSSNNLLVLYPEQFGDESPIPTMAESLSTDVVAAPSPLWLSVTNKLRALMPGKSQRKPRIDL